MTIVIFYMKLWKTVSKNLASFRRALSEGEISPPSLK